jgi:hypothetical protein
MAASAASASNAFTTNALTPANQQMTAHLFTDTDTAPYMPTTAHMFIVNSFPDIGNSPALGHEKKYYLLQCKLLPAYSHHDNTVFTTDIMDIFHHICSFHITAIIHGNYYQIYLLVLSILHVAAWTARYSTPSSIYDGALVLLVQSSFTL